MMKSTQYRLKSHQDQKQKPHMFSLMIWCGLGLCACDLDDQEAHEGNSGKGFRGEILEPKPQASSTEKSHSKASEAGVKAGESPVCADGVASPPLLEAQWLTDAAGENKVDGPIGGHPLSSGNLGLSLKANGAVAGKLLVVAYGGAGETRSREFDLETLSKGGRKKIKIPIKKWLKGFEGGKAPVQVSYSSELYDHEGRFLRKEPGGVLYLNLKSKNLRGGNQGKQAEEDWSAYDVESLQDFEEELTPESAQDPDPNALTPEDIAALDGFDPSHSRVVGLYDGGAGVLEEDPDHEGVLESEGEPEGEPNEGESGESGESGEVLEADREGAAQ